MVTLRHTRSRGVSNGSRGGRAGLTLLEVVIASGILAVTLLGVFSSMAHSMRMEALSREREVATRTALQELDNKVMAVSDPDAFDLLLTTPLDHQFDVTYDAGDGDTHVLKPAVTSPNPNGKTGRITVSVVPAGSYGGIDHMLEARAHVRWRASDDSDQEVVITSRKVRP